MSRNDHSRMSLGGDPSRRAVLRGLASAGSLLALGSSLGGCASALSQAGARFDAADLSGNPTMLVATTRKPVNGARAKPWFGPERSGKMTVARARMKAPDD